MTKTMIDHLKTRVDALLSEKGKKAAPFAVEIGLKPDVVRDILRKDAMPAADRVAAIADGLGVSIDYLLGRTDDRKATLGGVISSEPEILAFLSRIKGFTNSDINAAYGVIMLALNAKQAGSRPSEDRDPPEQSSPHRGSKPSRSKPVPHTS